MLLVRGHCGGSFAQQKLNACARTNVYPGRQTWRLKVRVERMWEMFPLDEPSKPFFVEMVLLDSEGVKIQASIRKPMMKKFKGLISEGDVCKMYFFGVVKNLGSYRATRHEYKLLFYLRTKVTRCESMTIPFIGLAPASLKDIMDTGGQSVVSLQNVFNTTRVLWNPDIAEVVEFKHSGVDMSKPLGTIKEHNSNYTPEEEFLHMFLRKTISELHETKEVRNILDVQSIVVVRWVFIVLASIVTVLDDSQWWYHACKCNRAVTKAGDSYCCSYCAINVSDVRPRYKLKFEVFDGGDIDAFIMFDSDSEMLTGISCVALLGVYNDNGADQLPPELDNLGGKELLFRVENSFDHAFKYDDTFKRKFHVPFPSLEDIADDFSKGHNLSKQHVDGHDEGDESFRVADFLSEQACCPIGSATDLDEGSIVVEKSGIMLSNNHYMYEYSGLCVRDQVNVRCQYVVIVSQE
ncbi:hypothetical protein SESBI_32017 [Sesbania bispinosa]|nr:hypothetical protein SESBI_32017 [Sesbania bispinosa]